MLGIMFLFELVKQLVFPDISLWESHGVTIVVTSILAVALVSYPLRDVLAESRRAKEALVHQKTAEENLRQAEAQYHSFIESAEDSIYTVDPDLHYLMMNSRHLVRQGMSPDHYVGKSYSDFHTPEQTREFAGQVWNVVETEQSLHAEYEQNDRYFLRKLNPVIDPADNRVIAVTVISAEITDRKQAEKKLEEINRKLNLMNDITRHDILNQLTVLNSYLQLAEDRSSDQAVSKYLVKSEQCTEAIHSQILFARDYQEIGVASPRWQNVSDTIMQARLPLKISSLTVDENCNIEIFADPLLEKVFYNLMENSLKYGGPAVDIRFSCRKDRESLVVSCEDNGTGISEEDKGKIFNRGYGKNTGLGLFLIKEILSITGISISENGDPGKGTRFEMRVPAGLFRVPGDDQNLGEAN
jgi:PAS domain S-box-containing protein